MYACRFLGTKNVVEERSGESMTAFRELGERALTSGGLHLAEGGRIWNAFRSAPHGMGSQCRHVMGVSMGLSQHTPMCSQHGRMRFISVQAI